MAFNDTCRRLESYRLPSHTTNYISCHPTPQILEFAPHSQEFGQSGLQPFKVKSSADTIVIRASKLFVKVRQLRNLILGISYTCNPFELQLFTDVMWFQLFN